MTRRTVLITGAGTATCQSVIKGLRSQQTIAARVITVDMQSENAGRAFSDAFHRVPAAGDPQYLDRLLDLCRLERVDLLVPIVDYEFAKVASRRAEFEDLGCRVAISDPEVVATCTDKWRTHEFFERTGIPTPKTWLPEDLGDPLGLLPLFVKPRILGRASIDTYRVERPEELVLALERVHQPLVQEAVEGREFTVDVLCDFEGRAHNAVVRERIETKSGVSTKGRTVRDDEILDLAVRIAEGLPIRGPANIQCFRTDDDIRFFEVNPRFSGTLALTLAAGFNSPLALLRMAAGDVLEPRVGDYAVGVTMMRYWQEVFFDAEGRRLPTLAVEAS